jgi:hypothetical protein
MDFAATAEQQELARGVLRFAESRLGTQMVRRDREGVFDTEGWRLCAEMGIQGLPVPERYGGQGQDLLTSCIILEALGEGCRDNGLHFSLNAQIWSVEMPILEIGTEEQRQRYLPGLCDGSLIGVHCMSEPDSGSDAMALRTRAVREGDDYILSGSKVFATNAPVGDLALVFANVRPELKSLGITAFLVERGAPGLTFGPPIGKSGMRTSPMGEVVLDEVRVPQAQRLGPEGGGMRLFQRSMEYERAFIFASQLGVIRRVYSRCAEYARTRNQFGQAIAKFTPVADRMIAMRTDVELAQLLLHKVAWTKDQGQPAPMEAAMAKLFISEAQVRATLDAMHIFGGYGYTTEYELEREHRDALAGRVYSGTSEIQRKLIAHYLDL